MDSRSVNGRGKNNSKNIFSKKLVCGHCGKGYIKSSLSKNGRRYVFYACGQRRRLGTCQNKSIMLSRLESFIKPYCDGKLHEILNSKKTDLIKWIGYSISLLEDKLNRVDYNKQALRTRITEIEAIVDTLIQQLIESSEQVKKAISRKIEQLEDERSKLETDLHSYDVVKIKAEINKLNETIHNINKSSTQKVFSIEEILLFVESITIDNEDLKIEFNFDKILPGQATVKDTLTDLLDKFKSASDEYKSVLDQM
ncbi:recombinase zinc beta ribbon domain-containing protein [Gottfriedia sp. NPDC058432]|uniref:recombinase zinc beta ribbon domain-containing protein n=1 Tax=Gottfriedia sp. NPDC058432 TaxID=3346497 RepID=UPI0036603D2A